LHRTTEDGGHTAELFELLVKFLKISSQFPENIDLAMRFFEIHYLNTMGYGLNIETCIRCKKEIGTSGDSCFLDLDHGGFICRECTKTGVVFSLESVKVLRSLLENKFSRVGNSVLDELEKITATLIDEHFGVKIKSRELL
jgi:DNA repair protein RecO (recombination protein O)